MTPEERAKAQKTIRDANNQAILKTGFFRKDGPRKKTPLPPIPQSGITRSHAEWAEVISAVDRVVMIYGAMEKDALAREYEVVAARLPILEKELLKLTRAIGGSV